MDRPSMQSNVYMAFNLFIFRRPRHFAGWIVGPIAIEAFHAPFDAPAFADYAEVFADRIMHGVLEAVGHEGKRAAVPARDGMRRPRPKCGLANLLESDDDQF